MIKSCMCCNHYHSYTVDYDRALGFYVEDNACSECNCPKSITKNLEYLEYKYEQTIH